MDLIIVNTKSDFGYVSDTSGKEKMIYIDDVRTPASSWICDEPLYR